MNTARSQGLLDEPHDAKCLRRHWVLVLGDKTEMIIITISNSHNHRNKELRFEDLQCVLKVQELRKM